MQKGARPVEAIAIRPSSAHLTITLLKALDLGPGTRKAMGKMRKALVVFLLIVYWLGNTKKPNIIILLFMNCVNRLIRRIFSVN